MSSLDSCSAPAASLNIVPYIWDHFLPSFFGTSANEQRSEILTRLWNEMIRDNPRFKNNHLCVWMTNSICRTYAHLSQLKNDPLLSINTIKPFSAFNLTVKQGFTDLKLAMERGANARARIYEEGGLKIQWSDIETHSDNTIKGFFEIKKNPEGTYHVEFSNNGAVIQSDCVEGNNQMICSFDKGLASFFNGKLEVDFKSEEKDNGSKILTMTFSGTSPIPTMGKKQLGFITFTIDPVDGTIAQFGHVTDLAGMPIFSSVFAHVTKGDNVTTHVNVGYKYPEFFEFATTDSTEKPLDISDSEARYEKLLDRYHNKINSGTAGVTAQIEKMDGKTTISANVIHQPFMPVPPYFGDEMKASVAFSKQKLYTPDGAISEEVRFATKEFTNEEEETSFIRPYIN